MAEQNADLLRRAEDLRARCEKGSSVTRTLFLTPAEQYALGQWAKNRSECRLVFRGGIPNTDRKVGFFLPFWLDESLTDPSEGEIRAVRIRAFFGTPGHRDYLGSALALGIKREWLGDIVIQGDTAWVLCLPTVVPVLTELDHVGRCGVKAEEVPLEEVPPIRVQTRPVTFTVKSSRFDTVVGAMFGMSRTAASKLIQAGLAQLNYTECIKLDAEVKEGDVISLRGYGKGVLAETGGQSRKGRTFLTAEIYK